MAEIMRVHHCDDLIVIFERCFFQEYNTCLVRGGDEPLYLPMAKGRPQNEIRFARGFFSSALHECAHWFIAGTLRRQQEDYGYWYQPDGRNATQQAAFEAVEIKPQALEWILSVAAGYSFRISADNLTGIDTDIEPFKDAVYEQVLHYLTVGLPVRAEVFRRELADFYQTSGSLQAGHFHKTTL